MSLNHLIENNVKPWLNGRMQDLTLDGDLSMGAGSEIISGGPMRFSEHPIVGAGGTNAVNLNYVYQRVTTAGGSASLTLAAGTSGQILIVSVDVFGGGNNCVIPAAQVAGTLQYTMNAVGQSVMLIYNANAGWSVVCASPGVTAA